MSTNEKEIFTHLQDLGCCSNCCLRYLCDKTLDFSDSQAILKQKNLNEKSNEEGQVPKKVKTNPCVVCLGLLQDTTLEDILRHEDLANINKYDSDVFTVSIRMPASVLLRERSMRLHLEDKFSQFFFSENIEIPLNRVWKMFIKNNIASQISKTFQNSDICDFSINVTTEYVDDEEELLPLKKMQPKIFETRSIQHRKFNGEIFSRKGVLSALEVTPSGVFKMYGNVPPTIPSNYLTCKGIECKHNSIYIAGRYCKFSRELSQTPWVIDGVKTMETSVQEIIFESLTKLYDIKPELIKFSSSGREDCDVRCLGNGRPFYLEIMDPKKTSFSFEEFREIEDYINKSDLIKVKDLQKVNRSDLVEIKMGEEKKTKNYLALCVMEIPVTQEMLDKINKQKALVLSQKTPIRVLHRRPLTVRSRKIIDMRAVAIEGRDKCFELHVETQAGTYVKEFVHGDFGRTTPSVGDIIGSNVDIIALDVMSINLDWPLPVDYNNK